MPKKSIRANASVHLLLSSGKPACNTKAIDPALSVNPALVLCRRCRKSPHCPEQYRLKTPPKGEMIYIPPESVEAVREMLRVAKDVKKNNQLGIIQPPCSTKSSANQTDSTSTPTANA